MRWHHRAVWLSRSISGSHYEDNWFDSWQDSNVLDGILINQTTHCRSRWPRGLRRRSAAARLLRLWVRIPAAAWVSVVSVVCCQVEVSATSWSLVQRSPTDCVVVCDLGNSWMRRPWPTEGTFAPPQKNKLKTTHILLPYVILYENSWQQRPLLNRTAKRIQLTSITDPSARQRNVICPNGAVCAAGRWISYDGTVQYARQRAEVGPLEDQELPCS
jgi:hypothetical protein